MVWVPRPNWDMTLQEFNQPITLSKRFQRRPVLGLHPPTLIRSAGWIGPPLGWPVKPLKRSSRLLHVEH